MNPSNAVYHGAKTIRLRGHEYELRGWEGYAYRISETSDMFIFQPEDARPDPENLEELMVLHKANTNQRLSRAEQKTYALLMDTVRFRVHEVNLTIIR